jgi:hypothetical protein
VRRQAATIRAAHAAGAAAASSAAATNGHADRRVSSDARVLRSCWLASRQDRHHVQAVAGKNPTGSRRLSQRSASLRRRGTHLSPRPIPESGDLPPAPEEMAVRPLVQAIPHPLEGLGFVESLPCKEVLRRVWTTGRFAGGFVCG